MIGSIRGTLIARTPTDVTVEACGVGYRLSVPLSTLSGLPRTGTEVFLYVYTHVREDAIRLYGFSAEEEKEVFTALLGVTGIGPKVAMGVISGISCEDFRRAVEAGEVDILTRIPGLGRKTANRVMLELRGKLPMEEAVADRLFEDTLSALVNLGYRRGDALPALDKARKKGHNDIEGLIKESLRSLTGAVDEKN